MQYIKDADCSVCFDRRSATMTRISLLIIIYVVMFAWAAPAHSQSCGGNVQYGGGNAGWIMCIPPGQAEAPVGVSLTAPGPQWETRWGAIAVDNGVGTYGGIEGFDSKRRAQKAAITECKKYGGKKCKVSIAYYNQCGVLASGDTYSITARGPDIYETAERAVNTCSKHTQNCKPYYGGCSYPERVR
jgi:hypothetical protein